jgi:pimeloyl-ACP methyl ester carboxylesterase
MDEFILPVTRYALSGDINIAYQTIGDGPVDIILVPGLVSHIEFLHEIAGYTVFLRGLSSFARVVTFDKRGQGLSEKIAGAPSLNSAWTTFAPSWTRPTQSAPSCSDP